MDWSLIVASNNQAILEANLASSPCSRRGRDFNVMRGFASAGAAYNAAMEKAKGELLVFAHQDVYFPDDWDRCLSDSLDKLSVTDPQWGVLGVWGMSSAGEYAGYSYCTGLQRVVGGPFEQPVESTSLDEAVIVLRRSAGLRFDEALPGFHLYGTDICLTARQKGIKSYVISAFCIHNTAGLKLLPWAFWRSYFYMRRKWWQDLPVRTPCTRIEHVPRQIVEHPLRSIYSHWIKRREVGKRVANPSVLYEELVRSGRLQPHTSATLMQA